MAATVDSERPLPKFGEWDVNDPRTAEGFTVIFSKASDDKKAGKPGNSASRRKHHDGAGGKPSNKKKWLCCTAGSD